jgi:hypothetical protein
MVEYGHVAKVVRIDDNWTHSAEILGCAEKQGGIINVF